MLISCPKNKVNENTTDSTLVKQDSLNGNSRKRSLPDNCLGSEENEPELMIIDFEYCAYNYRAFDIANHFLEWTYDYTNNKFPFFYYRPNDYPNSEQIDNFITSYLSNVESDSNDVPINEEKKQLLEEIKLFTLASHLFWGIWAIVNIHQDIEFGYKEYADIRFNEYFKAKELYLQMKPSANDFCDIEARRK
jgi:choline/ethanolamine kinase